MSTGTLSSSKCSTCSQSKPYMDAEGLEGDHSGDDSSDIDEYLLCSGAAAAAAAAPVGFQP